MTEKKSFIIIIFLVAFFSLWLQLPHAKYAHNMEDDEILILEDVLTEVDLYEHLKILSDNKQKMSVEDIANGKYDDDFVKPDDFEKKTGFFDVAKWIKFELHNNSTENDWLLEFAFPLIYQIHMYVADESGLEKIVTSGADYPFENREYNHRYFVFNLHIEPGETKTYYARIHGGADLHPPIKIWNKDYFIEKSHTESALLGLFYGMIIIMIFYNLFLYIGLRMRAYLYYVLMITSSMVAQLALNGFGFKYLWPQFPSWNTMAVPFWASIGFIFILLFMREFLDAKKHMPLFSKIAIGLVGLSLITISFLFIEHYVALNLMFLSAFLTFSTVIIATFISLIRGVREARDRKSTRLNSSHV